MADVKISGLPAAAAVSGTQEFEVNESGTSKKVTGSQLAAFVECELGTIATQDANNVTISGGSITGITDLAIADGGTAASTAQGARTNLLPSQTSKAGYALVTDGTDVSWALIGVADGDKGDITVSSSGAVWTIDSNAITTAKIADGNVTGAKLENSGVTANSYGSSTQVPVLTIDAKGRITSASTASVAAGGGGFSNMQVFTSSGTFTVPAGITKVKVTVVGGGGGGAMGRDDGCCNFSAGSGGGGGGAAIEVISGLTGGSTVSVTVGGGGAAVTYNYNGNAGGTSSFGAYCSATGGAGGVKGEASGGIGSGGQLNVPGTLGTPGKNYYTSCKGGNSLFGAGGGNAGAGRGYGGGGGGRAYPGDYSGAGSAGVVIVEY